MKNKKFKRYNTIQREEIKIVNKVMKTGVLSDYYANRHQNFLGGKYVNQFEKNCKKYFKVKNVITVNSWTSGLTTIIGAMNLKPGEEVILSPWTMSACLASIAHWGGIPVFCDIDKDTFNVDVKKIEKKITNKTKIIMAVDYFGQPCDMDELIKICKKYKIKLITDSAQSIGAKYKNKFSSTMSDAGGYSLNFHKHINTGEGGIIVTNNDTIAKNCQLLRNHAESTIIKKDSLDNFFGYNFRLTEIQAAIGIEQLKKLNRIIKKKNWIAKKLSEKLKKLPGLITPVIKKNRTHVFYSYPMKVQSNVTKVNRNKIWKMLKLEGVPVNNNIPCLHLMPIIQKKMSKKSHLNWMNKKKYQNIFKPGSLPVAERLTNNEILCLQMWAYDFTVSDIKFIIKKFYKVWHKLKLI